MDDTSATVNRYCSALATVLACACGDSVAPPPPVVDLEAAVALPIALVVEDSASVTVTASDAHGREIKGVTVEYESNDQEIVTVRANGSVSAHMIGETTITARVGDVTVQLPVVVHPKVIDVAAAFDLGYSLGM